MLLSPIWSQEGPFSKQRWDLDSVVTFKNNAPNQHINTIEIFRHRNENYQLMLTAKNRYKYQQVKKIILDAGFKELYYYDQDPFTIRLNTTSLISLIKFIESIATIDNNFQPAQQAIYQYLSIAPSFASSLELVRASMQMQVNWRQKFILFEHMNPANFDIEFSHLLDIALNYPNLLAEAIDTIGVAKLKLVFKKIYTHEPTAYLDHQQVFKHILSTTLYYKNFALLDKLFQIFDGQYILALQVIFSINADGICYFSYGRVGLNNNILNILKKYHVPLHLPILFGNLTPLLFLIQLGYIESVSLLLDSGQDLNINYVVELENGAESALSLAILHSNSQANILKIIEHEEIDVSLPDNKPIFYAAVKKNFPYIAQQCYQRGARLPSTQHMHSILLSTLFTFYSQRIPRISYLLSLGADWKFNDNEIIKKALTMNGICIQILINNNVSINTIFTCMISLNINSFAYHWRNLIKIKPTYIPPQSLMHAAILMLINVPKNNTRIKNIANEQVRLLLSKGYDPKFKQSEALEKAAMSAQPNLEIVKMLLKHGAVPHALLPILAIDGFSHLRAYERRDHLDIVILLLKKLVNEQLVKDKIIPLIKHDDTVDTLTKNVIEIILPTLSSVKKLAFKLLISNYEMKRATKESAMENSTTKFTQFHFKNKIEPALRAKFETVSGSSNCERVLHIEKEIKRFILKKISESGSKTISEFITTYQILLENGDPATLNQFRLLLIDKDDIAQTAWKGYDITTPCDPNWPSLLRPQTRTEAIFSTQASHTGTLSLKVGSDEVRYMIAIYFLADLNKMNFLQQLADIAHAHPENISSGSPWEISSSCYPGAIGRIGKMGEGHPLLQLPPDRRKIIHAHSSALILRKFSEQIEVLQSEQRESLYYGLTMLTLATAPDRLKEEETDFEETWVTQRLRFKELLDLDVFERAVNQDLKQVQEPTFSYTNSDKIFFECELDDLGGCGRGPDITTRYLAYTTSEPTLTNDVEILDTSRSEILTGYHLDLERRRSEVPTQASHSSTDFRSSMRNV